MPRHETKWGVARGEDAEVFSVSPARAIGQSEPVPSDGLESVVA